MTVFTSVEGRVLADHVSAIRRQPHTVYDVYDHDGALLYVGCTADLSKRMTRHARTALAGRVGFVVGQVTAPFEEARAIEAVRIHRLRPPLNKLRNPERRTAA